MANEKALLVTQEGPVLVLSNNAAPWNRMGFAYMDALESAIDFAQNTASVRALVFTAEGAENFSVGMDLKQLLAEINQRGGLDAILDQRQRVLGKIESMQKPSIATLFGNCLGGGLELPLACHFRLAASHGVSMGLPELDIGTVPAWGGSIRLTRLVGRARALDMILLARKVNAQEALHMGLVHALHPLATLKDAAMQLANELAAKPRTSVAGVLRSVVAADELSLMSALGVERQAVRDSVECGNFNEGVHAFIDKRTPVFD